MTQTIRIIVLTFFFDKSFNNSTDFCNTFTLVLNNVYKKIFLNFFRNDFFILY